jgi:hypothetical protein
MNCRAETVSKEDAAFIDRGKGTMIDMVDPQELKKVSDVFWKDNTHSALKMRTDILFCYAFTCRGDNSRNLKVSTVGIKNFPDVGVNGINILRTVWRKSKRNNFGHFEQTTLVRNKDVTRCPFGALGFLLFSRWQLGDEPRPDFTSRDRYYNIYLVEGSTSTTKLTYPKIYQELKEKYGVYFLKLLDVGNYVFYKDSKWKKRNR